MHEDATWYEGRPRPRRHCVRWEPSFPPLKRHSPNFRPMSVVAKWLDGLRCHLVWRLASAQATVFDTDPATPRKRAHPPHPIFGPCLLWQNGWMDEDATWYGSRPRPRSHCIRRGPSCPRKGHSSPPLFSAHVYCGHGRPSQLLLSSCFKITLKTVIFAAADSHQTR